MQQQQLDFTEGSIMKKMILFSWPIFVGNLLQSSYQIIDSLWVGNLLGAEALGAVSISATVIFTMLSFIIGINGATLTVLSQHKGAGNQAGLARSLNAFVFVLGSLAVMLGALGFFLAPYILRFMGTPESIMPMAETYLQINMLFIFLLFGYNFVGTVLRALGDSKTPLRFIFLAVILNTILTPIFIHVLGLGIQGAAIATVLSQGTALVVGLYISIAHRGVPYSMPRLPDWEEFKRLFRLGLPSGLSMMAISGGVLAIMTVVTSFGDTVVAGYGAAQRVDSLIMLPGLTLGSAIQSMAGQNIGAQLWDRVTAIAKSGVLLILGVATTISLFVFLMSGIIMSAFVDDTETVAFGSTYLQLVAFFYPFLGINFVLNGIVRAAGAMVPVLILNIVSFWVLRFPLAWLLSSWFGPEGIAVGIGLSFIISAAIAALYYRFGRWRNIQLVENEDEGKEESASTRS
ncbi:putative MATE family efflux protein [Salsuginibacillus halophilus]|uniref:Putative MATE family efflux protein n=1 Tax=Salsuginibacillus halophilus TaxID=517424 RepID=A0A2P8HBK6_9BACI|nr:putative MATE family efflux protein [Salsuginibacillus halophilus]